MCRPHSASVDTTAVTEVDDGSSEPAFDLPRIVETFNRHGITYLAIGGVSGPLHGAVHFVTQEST